MRCRFHYDLINSLLPPVQKDWSIAHLNVVSFPMLLLEAEPSAFGTHCLYLPSRVRVTLRNGSKVQGNPDNCLRTSNLNQPCQWWWWFITCPARRRERF